MILADDILQIILAGLKKYSRAFFILELQHFFLDDTTASITINEQYFFILIFSVDEGFHLKS